MTSTNIINTIINNIASKQDTRISLLSNPEVVQYLFGDHSFFPKIERKNKTQDTKKLKICEDEWGRSIMKKRRPDLKMDKQWGGLFGEYICEELFILLGETPYKPTNMNNFQPDLGISNAIIESKMETFYTEGTVSEKILGTPFKYADIPELYGKPLIIVILGGAEQMCRDKYGNLIGDKQTTQKNKFIEFYKANNISFVGITDLLNRLL